MRYSKKLFSIAAVPLALTLVLGLCGKTPKTTPQSGTDTKPADVATNTTPKCNDMEKEGYTRLKTEGSNFNFLYPSEFEVTTAEKEQAYIITNTPQVAKVPTSISVLSIEIVPNLPNQTAEAVGKNVKAGATGKSGFKLLKEEATTICGLPAYTFTYQYSESDYTAEMRTAVVTSQGASRNYVLTFLRDASQAQFEDIGNTFFDSFCLAK